MGRLQGDGAGGETGQFRGVALKADDDHVGTAGFTALQEVALVGAMDDELVIREGAGVVF